MSKRHLNVAFPDSEQSEKFPEHKESSATSKRQKKIKSNSKKNENTFIKSLSYTIRNDDDPHVWVNDICTRYIKIGDYIYKVKSFNDIEKNISDEYLEWSICLNESQLRDIKNIVFDRNKVVISGISKSINTVNRIDIDINTLTNHKIFVTKNDITDYIRNLLKGHIVTVDQNFSIHYNGIPMTITIKSIDDTYFGKITEDTLIYFKTIDFNIFIQNQCIEISKEDIIIHITNCISVGDSDVGKISKFPLIIDNKVINKYIRQTFSKPFINNSTMIYTKNDFEFTFCVKIIDSHSQKFENTYILPTEGLFDVKSNTNNIIITTGKTKAKKICFHCNSSKNATPENNIILLDDLTSFVSNKVNKLTNNQTIKYHSKTLDLVLKTEYIEPLENNKTMYIINSNTKFSFITDKKSELIVVHNSDPIDIDELTIKIKNGSSNLFAMIFGGNDDSDKSTIFNAKKLEKVVRNKFPNKTTLKHKSTIEFNGCKYIFSVKNIKFKTEIENKSKKYKIYGKVNDATKIIFKTSKSNKSYVISDPIPSIDLLSKPIEELEKNVGGISKEIQTVVRTICLSRGKLKSEYISRGHKPVKGIIFHGPPGTGKTTLARNLGKILGCEGERFKLMSGPEIFSKWVGESEKNIRSIFKPAKEAWKKHGDKSPVYMVVIDEIDAMIPARSGSSGNPVRDSVVNQFLAEMDGLEVFSNLICVGITNRLELLDPATIRSGRFGIHIKVDLPDKTGRVKIFEIHTKKLKDSKKLEDVDFNKLSELTDGFSGADIESITELASTYSLERLNELPELNDNIIALQGKITMNDFIKATKEILSSKNKSDNQESLSRIYL
ncbi:putative AAA family ATPase [Cotonvirus japonicus]|uniref:AAA family ATPase n=1 Tax=Cotonvirus japonicus TaxID=2811091 RepID=A0ABM7NSB8_9VIRU|nr:putative AAA family ATPase [Cotonvirus japonicus]BCS83062.1 putative AAA family ATPase [Cotonvirus japonicus]